MIVYTEIVTNTFCKHSRAVRKSTAAATLLPVKAMHPAALALVATAAAVATGMNTATSAVYFPSFPSAITSTRRAGRLRAQALQMSMVGGPWSCQQSSVQRTLPPSLCADLPPENKENTDAALLDDLDDEDTTASPSSSASTGGADDSFVAAAVAMAGLTTIGFDVFALNGELSLLGIAAVSAVVASTADNTTIIGRGIQTFGALANSLLEPAKKNVTAMKGVISSEGTSALASQTVELDANRFMGEPADSLYSGATARSVVSEQIRERSGLHGEASEKLCEGEDCSTQELERLLEAMETVDKHCKELLRRRNGKEAAEARLALAREDAARGAAEAATVLRALQRRLAEAEAAHAEAQARCEAQDAMLAEAKAAEGSAIAALRQSQRQLSTVLDDELRADAAAAATSVADGRGASPVSPDLRVAGLTAQDMGGGAAGAQPLASTDAHTSLSSSAGGANNKNPKGMATLMPKTTTRHESSAAGARPTPSATSSRASAGTAASSARALRAIVKDLPPSTPPQRLLLDFPLSTRVDALFDSRTGARIAVMVHFESGATHPHTPPSHTRPLAHAAARPPTTAHTGSSESGTSTTSATGPARRPVAAAASHAASSVASATVVLRQLSAASKYTLQPVVQPFVPGPDSKLVSWTRRGQAAKPRSGV